MKAVKITLLFVLFLSLSSQTSKKSAEDTLSTYENNQVDYNLIAHSREKMQIPGQG